MLLQFSQALHIEINFLERFQREIQPVQMRIYAGSAAIRDLAMPNVGVAVSILQLQHEVVITKHHFAAGIRFSRLRRELAFCNIRINDRAGDIHLVAFDFEHFSFFLSLF